MTLNHCFYIGFRLARAFLSALFYAHFHTPCTGMFGFVFLPLTFVTLRLFAVVFLVANVAMKKVVISFVVRDVGLPCFPTFVCFARCGLAGFIIVV